MFVVFNRGFGVYSYGDILVVQFSSVSIVLKVLKHEYKFDKLDSSFLDDTAV